MTDPSIFAQSRPGFLDRLDSDPHTAAEEFYNFVLHLLSSWPPTCYRALSEDDKREFLQELIICLIEDQFRKLKSYVDRGLPFSAWLTVVISNKCRDFLRSKNRDKSTESISPTIDASEYAHQLRSKELTPFEQTAYKALIQAVKSAVAELPYHCRLMLHMAAEETSFVDMQKLLGPQWKDAKKVSDDLRYCRKRLKDILTSNGINLEEWFGNI